MTNTRTSKTEYAYMDMLIQKYGYFLTVTDICEILKVSRRIVDPMIRSGEIPSERIGKRSRVAVDTFVAWNHERCSADQKERQVSLYRKFE